MANKAGSHAEGLSTTAIGTGSHAEGYSTIAEGDYSHAGGYRTLAKQDYQTVIGRNNADATTEHNTYFIVGKGLSSGESARANAMEVTSHDVIIES
jgi:hypothetical protein